MRAAACVLALAFVLVAGAGAVPQVEERILAGVAQLDSGRPGAAAELWLAAAGTVPPRRSPDAPPLRPILYAAAAAAFDRAGDPRAAPTWRHAMETFIDEGTVWVLEREPLRRAAMAGDRFIAPLERALNLSQYVGPVMGRPGPPPGLRPPAQTGPRPEYGQPFDPNPIPLPGARPPIGHLPPPPDTRPLQNLPGTPLAFGPDLAFLADGGGLPPPPRGDPQPLSAERITQLARLAWRYFEVNRQPATGLINAVHRYQQATMWDVASGIAGYVAAERLGVLPRDRFVREMRVMLQTLATMPLYRDELPNREYHTRSAQMLDLHSALSPRGSGWSALDIARLALWLDVVRAWHPELRLDAERVVQRWDVRRFIVNGELFGTLHDGRAEAFRQEGRLGYEQYAAFGLRRWGLRAPRALDYDFVREVDVLGVRVSHDTRNHAFLVSEPFFLAAMETGIPDQRFASIMNASYEAMRRRAARTGALVAVSEDSLDRPPWFSYNTVYMDNMPWRCVSSNARPIPFCETFSVKAAFAWYAVRPDAYSRDLFDRAARMADPAAGFHTGIYDDGAENRAININTNAVVLEALLYVQRERKPFVEAP